MTIIIHNVAFFFNKVLSRDERERLTDNISGNLINAEEFLQQRAVAMFAAVDKNYGKMIQDKLLKLSNNKSKSKAPGYAKKISNL